ncbi:MAG: M14 family metallopeptidase [Arenimonas sp.]|uniref:M14 family metallopeptidase n=1 Tax=Arenimonas sp. TaxID=1872635 RepID=UPI0025C2C278|nr:M14 family metallopeptidase [Arenimonas sp.]MBW8367292.1 M14 family metallopeptidase [Arenimonas sp.]
MRNLVLALALALSASAAADDTLVTVSERSGFLKTGRYAEVIALCDAFAKAHPQAVRCIEFGTTPQGRPMKALVVSTSGALDAEAARKRGLPVVLIQGGIHSGEIDGKDAGFLALRQILEGKAAPGALDKLVWVFVPVFNIDGHERFGAWNRPNQRGPEEMGWRTTAQNYNLNRDYLKADAPEMQAMLALVNEWDPLAVVDLHATNGAQFEHDIAIMVEPLYAGDLALQRIGREWRDGVIADLTAAGSLPLAFYPSFVADDDPSSGFADTVSQPRFSLGYFWLRNRLSMLVETHSWRAYPERVLSTRHTVVSVLDLVAENGEAWLQAAHDADRRASQPGTAPMPLTFAATDQARLIDFRGYEYTRTPSDVSGALMTRYDETKPQVWRVPLRDVVEPVLSVAPPAAGYLVPAEHAERVGAKLALHGVAFRKIGALPQAAVQVFRAESAKPAAASFEGHQRLDVTGEWADETQDIAAGALFVPIAQPRSRLLVAMLEPQAPDSLLAWGNFNNHFEQKEYMEGYVAEAVARDMMARDPALKARFEQQIKDDPAFAASPQARLQYFHRLHSSWDGRLDLYPVLRMSAVPQ